MKEKRKAIIGTDEKDGHGGVASAGAEARKKECALGRKRSSSPGIEGVVTPLKLDREGHPVRIALRTAKWMDYRIDFSGSGKELLELVDRRVLVHGRLRQQLDGGETLVVRRYEVLEPEPL